MYRYYIECIRCWLWWILYESMPTTIRLASSQSLPWIIYLTGSSVLPFHPSGNEWKHCSWAPDYSRNSRKTNTSAAPQTLIHWPNTSPSKAVLKQQMKPKYMNKHNLFPSSEFTTKCPEKLWFSFTIKS